MANSYQTTAESFMKDVANHKLTVVRDEGLYRHLRFSKPDTMCMHFDLITWPGYLCYTGDMGTYVFTRLKDMFVFFRDGHDKDGNIFRYIDKRYWAEKVEAGDKCNGIRKFSEEKFNRAVMGDLIEWLRSHRQDTTKEDRRELWDAVVRDVIGADGDSGGYRKQVAAHDFSHEVNIDVGTFWFKDFWEHNVDEFTTRFVWCCYALRWGVDQYDQAKKAQEQEVAHVQA